MTENEHNERNSTAQEILARNFPVSGSGPSKTKSRTAVTKNPAKLATIRKVELMKMRQKAKPGDPKVTSIGMSDRHYVLAKCNEIGNFSAFWFLKVNMSFNGLNK